jgi:RHS repeat-associated protein
LASVTYGSIAAGYSTPANVSYTYNPDQTRATMTDATGTTTYSYDAMGDLTSEALAAGAGTGLANQTTSYGYFSTGGLASVTYPAYGSYSSPEVSYDYDPTGAMASETDWLGNTVSFAHDASGNQTGQDNDVSTSAPNGTSSTSWSYDNAGYNSAASSALAQTCGGAETLSQSFTGTTGSRNADGQVTAYEESYSGSCSGQSSYQRAYSYDPAGRVVYQGSAAQGSAPNNFAYDPSGDPTTISAHSSGAFDTYTQAFDPAGEVLSQTPVTGSSGAASSYAYDTLGDLASTAGGAGSGTIYAYNSLGQMTSTSGSSGASTLVPGDIYTLAGSPVGTGGHSGGSGPATSALLGEVNDVVADANGNIYIADTSNNRVQEVAATTHSQWGISMTAGDVYTIAGSASGTSGSSGDGGAATSALLSSPTGVALDAAGNLYIADQANNRAQFVAAATCSSSCRWGQSTTIGYVYTIAGTGTAGHSGDGGAATSAHLDLPTGVALDAAGNLYIADQYNNRVQFVAAATCSSSCRWGLSTTANDMYTIAGSSSGTEGHSGDGGAATSALLNDPSSVALDSADNLYIADTDNNRVQFVAAATCSSSCPFALSSTTANDIYTLAGSSSGSAGGSGDGGVATSALLSSPTGLALDSSGNLYVADSGNNRAQLVAASACSSSCPLGLSSTTKGDIYTVAGSASGSEGESGEGGLATSALLDGVAGVGTDSAGDLYLADTYNFVVDEVPAASSFLSATYTYNGDGLEASRTTGVTLSQFTWADAGSSALPVVISDGANDHVYGPGGQPVEQVALATSTPTYLTYTPASSTWVSANQAGDEAGSWGYDAFGTLAFGTPTSPFGYSGQYQDATSGFVNDRARWYQAQTGEFTTRDPDFAGTDTAYTYAGDDPVNEDDPSGLWVVSADYPYPQYCYTSAFLCSTTAWAFPSEDQFESVAGWYTEYEMPGTTTQQQYRVYPPSGAATTLNWRIYDLYNAKWNTGAFSTGGPPAQAWELKVGYQTATQRNISQINFDVELLQRNGVGYRNALGLPPDIGTIEWWEVPQDGGYAGLSPALVNALNNADTATAGRFFAEIDFPVDGSGQKAPKSRPIGPVQYMGDLASAGGGGTPNWC